jgi:hypothetical protein
MPVTATVENNVEDLTLRDLFSLSPDSPVELAAGLKAEDFKDIGKKLSTLSQPIPWSHVQSEIAAAISGTLNTTLLDAWASAWKKYQAVKEAVEDSRKSPDEVVLTPLTEHSVESTLHPYVEVLLGPTLVQRITFDVIVTTQLKGVILGIKNSCIVSLHIGECGWTGSIGTRGVVLVQRKLTKLDLPGRIRLKRCIPLGTQAKT